MEYYEATLANIRKLDCFDVYGHIDYIVRYAPKSVVGIIRFLIIRISLMRF